MKRLRAVLLAAAALLLPATPAHADPASISAAIAAAWTWLSSAAAAAAASFSLGEFLISVAVSVGLSYLAQALGGKPSGAPSGVSGTIQSGGIVPRSFIVGRYATAGSLVYTGTWGSDGDTPNAYYTQVIALSDLPMTALQEVWEGSTKGIYDPAQTAIAQGRPIKEFTKDGRDNLWVIFHDGRQTVSDPFLNATFGADPDFPWHSTMVGVGVAHAIVTARMNPQVFSGFPSYKFAGLGAAFYDQRADSSAGGSGTQRFDDQTTWAHTLNPIVIVNNILRGISYAGQPLYGLEGMPASRLPSASWFAAMNECDAFVEDLNGNDVAQYRCGAEIPVNVMPADMIDSLNMSCNARIAEIGGIYKILAGAAGAPVMSFSDDEIFVDQPQTADQFPPIEGAINGVTATYVEPAAAWEAKDLPIRKNEPAIDADGENFGAVTYATVLDPGQGQRLQLAALNEALNHRRNAITLPPYAIVLEPLDVISWTSPRNGYDGKAMLCSGATIASNLNIPLALSELDPTDYDWFPGDELPMVFPVAAPPILPAATTAPTGFAALQAGGTVTLVWDLMVNYGFTGYDILLANGYNAPLAAAHYIAQDVHANYAAFSNIPAGDYTFFIVARDALDIPGQPARGAPASINFTVLPSSDIDVTEIQNDVLDLTEEMRNRAQVDFDISEALARLSFAVNNADRNNFKASASATEQLTQTTKDNQNAIAQALWEVEARLQQGDIDISASVVLEMTARVAADEAEATARLELEASMHAADVTLQANITNEQTARVTADQAEASARQALEVELKAADQTLTVSITNEQTARISADAAEASARQALEIEMDTADQNLSVAITNEQNARISADTAEASARQALEVELETADQNLSAAITNEQNARINADAIEASARQALEVEMDTADANLAASVTNEQNARISADGVLASNISTVSTTVDGHTISISTNAASINALHAYWGVQIVADGIITGSVKLDGTASKSTFTVQADAFRVKDPSGEVPLFDVSSGQAKFNVPLVANLIVASNIQASQIQLVHMSNGSVDTVNLVGDAATIRGKDNFSAVVSILDTAWHTLTPNGVQKNFVASTECDIDFTVAINNQDNGDHAAAFRIIMDGSVVVDEFQTGGQGYTVPHTGNAAFTFCTHYTPPAGLHRFDAQWSNTSVGTTALTARGTLRVEQIKR